MRRRDIDDEFLRLKRRLAKLSAVRNGEATLRRPGRRSSGARDTRLQRTPYEATTFTPSP